MKKEKVRTFRSRLREDLKDSEFKAHYQEERQALKLAMKIAKLREKKDCLSTIGKAHGYKSAGGLAGSRAESMKASPLRPWRRSPKRPERK